jgi:hypothetical protein
MMSLLYSVFLVLKLDYYCLENQWNNNIKNTHSYCVYNVTDCMAQAMSRYTLNSYNCCVQGKGKVHPRTGHGGSEGQ